MRTNSLLNSICVRSEPSVGCDDYVVVLFEDEPCRYRSRVLGCERSAIQPIWTLLNDEHEHLIVAVDATEAKKHSWRKSAESDRLRIDATRRDASCRFVSCRRKAPRSVPRFPFGRRGGYRRRRRKSSSERLLERVLLGLRREERLNK